MTKMKFVVDKNEMKIIQVPDDFIECSICHKWCDPKEFNGNDEYGNPVNYQMRTNCSTCYHLPYDDFKKASLNAKEFDRSLLLHGWDEDKNKLARKFQHLCGLANRMNKAITKKEILESINELFKDVPDDALIDDWPDVSLAKISDPKSGHYVFVSEYCSCN